MDADQRVFTPRTAYRLSHASDGGPHRQAIVTRTAWHSSKWGLPRPSGKSPIPGNWAHWPCHRVVLQRRRLAPARRELRHPMGFPVRLCALVGNFSDPRVAESVNALIPHLLSRQIEIIVSTETPYSGPAEGIVRMPEAEIGKQADLVIAIGGDGTLLYAAGLVARDNVPLLGVNRGRLGFLTDVMPQNMFPCIDAALEGK